MKYCIIFCLLFPQYITAQVLGQKNRPKVIGWQEGSVTLMDGSSHYGFLYYDHEKAFLYYKHDNEESETLKPNEVESFSFYDSTKNHDRFFLSILYEDGENGGSGTERFYFFEIFHEFKDFAILGKIDPLHTETKTEYYMSAPNPSANQNMPRSSRQVTLKLQDETIYVFDKEGRIEPYLVVDWGEDFEIGKKRSRIIKEELLHEHLGSDLAILKKYAKENGLSFSKKDDFLEIMGHYKSLVSN